MCLVLRSCGWSALGLWGWFHRIEFSWHSERIAHLVGCHEPDFRELYAHKHLPFGRLLINSRLGLLSRVPEEISTTDQQSAYVFQQLALETADTPREPKGSRQRPSNFESAFSHATKVRKSFARANHYFQAFRTCKWVH